MLKNNMCEFYSHSVDAIYPTICCCGKHNNKQVKFLKIEGRDRWHSNFCSNQYRSCVEYKILKAKENCR